LSLIEVDKLTKRYAGAQANAVDGVSFAIEQGEFFTLLGPNGAGKTTTISVLTTTLAPTSGEVRVGGFDVHRNASEVRKQLGIIFQKPSLDLNLTADENVRFHAVLYGVYPFRPAFRLMPKKYQQQIEELATLLGIHNELFKPIRTFSGGMRRKLEIVRSLMHQPRVLFLDEPTLGLDPVSRRGLWEYLMAMRATGDTTMFLTTHYLEEAETADRVCVIDKGKLVASGTPDQLKAQLLEDYLLIDANDRAALAQELRAQGVPFERNGGFKLHVRPREVHTVLRAIQTPLTLVKTHAPTLEDAYLEIVRRAAAE
jgi:ABC-2 type transport system ATP-binding protein